MKISTVDGAERKGIGNFSYSVESYFILVEVLALNFSEFDCT
jgi:hypothetical protein